MKTYAFLLVAILASPLLSQASDAKEVDFSGLSQFKPGDSSPGAPKYKASCTSRHSGQYNSDEKGFDACLSEVQQGNSQNPKRDAQLPNGSAPSIEFKTDVK